MPVDGLVEFKHTVFLCRRTDEPRVQRIIEHGFVCTPAVWVVVHVLLYLECCTLFFHLKTDDDVEVHILVGSLLVIFSVNIIFRVVSILYVIA